LWCCDDTTNYNYTQFRNQCMLVHRTQLMWTMVFWYINLLVSES